MELPLGGEDAVAEIAARMMGWKVQSFPEYQVYHHRQTGTAEQSALKARFKDGIKDYIIGYHPLFETVRTVHRFRQKPYVLGSGIRLLGYFYAVIRNIDRPISSEFIEYLHREQKDRLKHMFGLKART